MPKIIVRERDNTTPGLGEYSNYSVLVPGFSLKSDVFDENGIAEFTSASDFVNQVGKVAPVAFPKDFATFGMGGEDKTDWYEVVDASVADEAAVKRQATFSFKITNAKDTQNKLRLVVTGQPARVDVPELWSRDDTALQFISLTAKIGNAAKADQVQLTPEGAFEFTLNASEAAEFTASYLDSLPEGEAFYAGFAAPEDKPIYHYSEYVFSINGETTSQPGDWTTSDFPAENNPKLWLGIKNVKTLTGETTTVDAATNAVEGIKSSDTGESSNYKFNAVPAHYGNQIAYSLLSLGCPVVYLNLGTLKVNPANYDIGSDAASTSKEVGECQYLIGEGLKKLADDATWAPLRDKAQYDFRFAVTGLINGLSKTAGNSIMVKAEKAITNLCAFQYDTSETDIDETTVSVRGDATALLDVDEDLINAAIIGNRTQTSIINAIKRSIRDTGITSKYAAFFVPSICYAGIGEDEYANNNKLPASFHYLACFTRSIALGNPEWFAPAGLSRGISDWTVEGTAYDLGEIAVNALEPRAASVNSPIKCNVACNVIVRVRNAYYLWGNRTAYQLGDVGSADGDLIASHFLNIRQLCTTLKKQIYISCRRTIFDPNSDILWQHFCNSIRPTLEFMKANQGIGDYKIVPVTTNQKGKLKAKVRIVPIEAVEDFDIEISLEDSLGAVAATITE